MGGELPSTFFSLHFISILFSLLFSFFPGGAEGSNFFNCALNVLQVLVLLLVELLDSGRLTFLRDTLNSPGGEDLLGRVVEGEGLGGEELRGGEGGFTLADFVEGGSDLALLQESVLGSRCLRLTPKRKLASSTDGAGVSRSSAGGGGGNSKSGGAGRGWNPPELLLRIIFPGCSLFPWGEPGGEA